jgi:hypothetical protein
MTPEARAARERKQKIFVVVGGLVLLALLAFQLPRLLGGSSGSTAAPETAVAGESTATTPSQVVPIAVVGTHRPQLRATGKLTSFSAFRPKDPFVQQVKTESSFGATEGSAPAKSEGKETKTSSKGFTVGASGAALTIISVNGARQALEPGDAFPTGDPVFVLVAELPDKKAAVVGVAGGAYANGARATRLKVGKPLTLVNTTTGARYRVVLVAVGSGADSKASKTEP